MPSKVHLPCGDKPLHICESNTVTITENGVYDVEQYKWAIIDIHDLKWDSHANGEIPDLHTALSENTYVGDDLLFDSYAEATEGVVDATALSENSYIGADLTFDSEAEAVEGEISATAISAYEYDLELQFDSKAEVIEE